MHFRAIELDSPTSARFRSLPAGALADAPPWGRYAPPARRDYGPMPCPACLRLRYSVIPRARQQSPLHRVPDRPKRRGSTRRCRAGPSVIDFSAAASARSAQQLPLGVAGHELRPGAAPCLRPPSSKLTTLNNALNW